MQQGTAKIDTIELESDRWRLQLQPQMGLQTRYCKLRHDASWFDIMPDCSAEGAPLSASNFHMLPYSNRIKDGKFSYAGKDYELANGEQHSIHGALRKLAWRVTEQTSKSVTAEYDTREDGAVNWPWPIKAQIRYELSDDSLLSQMSVTNHGTHTMPAGMGWHPYFCRSIGGAEPTLTLPTTGVYPDTDGDCLPTGKALALPDNLNFNQPQALDSQQRIDHCLAGFQSPATIAWPDSGITLLMHASSNCTHVVLFNPEQTFFAVEPVTNANDGVNLVNKAVDSGVIDLPAGQTLTAEMKLTFTGASLT